MSEAPLFEKAFDYQALKRSYKQTQLAGRKFRKEAIVFDMARERNLVALWRDLKNQTYRPQGYITFSVFNPKERLIHAPRIRDKVAQFAAHKVLEEIYTPVYIKDSYAAQIEKGEHQAVDAVQHYMRLCQWKHGSGWILKLDVKKYFYSINRDILKQILRKKIKDPKFLWYLDITIDASPEGEKGLPLGCCTSQDFATLYLNELDQYAKRFLAIKWYVRYMDDVIAIFPTKEEAQETRDKFIAFLRDRLDLQANMDKTKIFPIAQGVNAYGCKIFTTHRLVRDSSKRAMKRRIKRMAQKVRSGEMTRKEVQTSVNSWLGHARHTNSYNLAKKIFRPYRYIKVEHKTHRFGRKAPE